MALELTEQQIAVLKALAVRGFEFVAWPLYASYVGVRKKDCGALLAPVPQGGMSVFGSVFYLLDGNPAVRVMRGGRNYFVFKKAEVEASNEMDEALQNFSRELAQALSASPL